MTSFEPFRQGYEFDWRGITVSVEYKPGRLDIGPRGPRYERAQLEVSAFEPWRARLPISKTGYWRDCPDVGVVENKLGPVMYVFALLERAAESPELKAYEAKRRRTCTCGAAAWLCAR